MMQWQPHSYESTDAQCNNHAQLRRLQLAG